MKKPICKACRDTGHVLIIKSIDGFKYEFDYACTCPAGQDLIYEGEPKGRRNVRYARPSIANQFGEQVAM